METNYESKEITVEDMLTEYVEKNRQYKQLEEELKMLKLTIDSKVEDDFFAIEGVGQFKRKASFTRKSLDKKKVEEKLSEEDFNSCFKESNVKGSIEIVDWDTVELRKRIMEEKKQ